MAFITGQKVWDRIRPFFGTTTTDLKILPPLSGGRVSVLQGGAAATGSNQVDIYSDGTYGYIDSKTGSIILAANGTNRLIYITGQSWTIAAPLVPDSDLGRQIGSTAAKFTGVYAGSYYSGTTGSVDVSLIRKAANAWSVANATLTGAGILSVPDPTTDVVPLIQTIHGSNAWAQATGGNRVGGSTVVVPGCGSRFLTVSNFASILAGATVTVTVDGVATVLTGGGTNWSSITSNNATATSIAAAINGSAAGTSCVATASGAVVYVQPNGNVGGIILASSDGTNLAVTSGTDGTLVVRRPGGNATTNELRISNDGSHTYLDSRGSGDLYVQRGGVTSFRTTSTNSGLITFGPILASGVAAGICGVTAGVTGPLDTAGAAGGGWFQNTGGSLMLDPTAFTNATATLNATTLTWTLIAGRRYKIQGHLIVSNSTAGDGFQMAFTGDGTVTATRTRVIANNLGTNVAGTTVATALAGVINYTSVTGTDDIILSGEFVCGVGGVVTLKVAGNTAVSGTMTLAAGSWVKFEDMVAK